jgi:hypothetical protein
MRGPRSLKQERPLLDTEEGESVETDTNSQPKKPLSRQSKSKKNPESVLKMLEENTWNPFVRVDPKILEMLHRKHEKARKYYLLTEPGKAGVHQTEDAPI